MTDNPYAPPAAPLDDVGNEAAPFYVVGAAKFVVLYLATLGTYALYWFYRNWRLNKEATGEDMWPVARAIFSIFFIHALFRRVEQRLDAAGRRLDWNPEAQATLLVVLLVVSNVLDRVSARIETAGVLDVLSLVLLLPLAVVFLKAQAAINLACGDAAGDGNRRLTAANYLWIAIGGVLWVLILVGTFFADGLQ